MAAADAVIAAINTSELAAFMALRAPADTDELSSSSSEASTGGSSSYKQQKAEKDAAKAALLEALRVKLKAQLEVSEVCGSNPWICFCDVACVLHVV
jgi:hypothetical protein